MDHLRDDVHQVLREEVVIGQTGASQGEVLEEDGGVLRSVGGF